jgi:hypothetical protein
MRKQKPGYPFLYGDPLSPKESRADLLKISRFKKEILVTILFIMSSVRPTGARDSFLPGAEEFIPQPSITRPQNSGSKTNLFGTQITTGAGS